MLTSPSVPTLAEEIRPELEPDERVRWVGRPDAVRVRRQSLPISLFGIVWIALSLRGPILSGDWFRDLFLGSFVLVGIAITLYPWWVCKVFERTIYAITDRRVLVVSRAWPQKMQSYYPSDFVEITRTDLAEGRGDLTFARELVKNGDGPDQYRDVQLIGIPDVRQAEDLLRVLKAG